MSTRSEPAVSKALVGPLPVIHFGIWRDVRVAYDVPRDTRDLRHAACTQHHPACDCREAELSEVIDEYAVERKALKQAATTVLRGHRLYDHDYDRRRQLDTNSPEWNRLVFGDGPLACQCTGCQILRATHVYIHTDLDGVVK